MHFALTRERLHAGSSAEVLIDALLLAHEQGLDPMSLPLEEADRNLLAAVLMDEHEELTPELLENSIRSLRRRVFRRQLEDLQHQLKEAERRQDSASAARLLQERIKLRRAMTAMGESRRIEGRAVPGKSLRETATVTLAERSKCLNQKA